MGSRTWLRWGLYGLVLSVPLLPLLDAPPLATGAYLQDVTVEKAVVCKVTAGPLDLDLLVELGDGAGRRLTSRGVRRHEFVVDGLAPGRTYPWRLVAADAVDGGEAGVIRTPPDPATGDSEPVRFAFVGDSGGLPWWIWMQTSWLFRVPVEQRWLPVASDVAAIGERLAAAQPDFVLHVGDVVYPRGQQQHYGAGFFRPFAAALRQAPFYVALGNHDVMDDDGRQALANFVLPRGGATGDERCYSFAWGSVRVIALDLGLEVAAPGGRPLAAEHPAVHYLRRQLPTCDEPWVVVLSHYPILSASRQNDRADLRLQLLPILEDYGVDLYLSGHDHTYQRFGEPGEGVVQIVSGGGGKSLYAIRTDPRVRVAQSVFHWCRVEAVGRTLELRALGLDGAPIDSVRLDREVQGPRFERLREKNPARAARILRLPE